MKPKLFHLLKSVTAFTAVVWGLTSHSAYSAAVPGRISVNGTQFQVCNQRIWMNGVNTPWDNWNDFGGTYDANFWSTHYQTLNTNGINSSRVWITCSGEVGINISAAGNVSGATAAHWANLDNFFATAQSRGVYVMATLMSFDHFKNTYTTYQSWRNWINSDANIDSYINNYLIPFLTRYGNNPALWSIDMCNEPDWATTTEPSAENGTIQWARFQQFWAKASNAIHVNSPVLVTVGIGVPKYNSDAAGMSGNRVSDVNLRAQVNLADESKVKLDFWSPHYYGWMDASFGIPFYETPASYGYTTDRPSMIGECPAPGSTGHTIAQDLDNAYANGWQGLMPWTSNAVDSIGAVNMTSMNNFRNAHAALIFPTCPSGNTSTPTRTSTPTATRTSTATSTRTNTLVILTSTPTRTSSATSTRTATSTNTLVVNTSTATRTTTLTSTRTATQTSTSTSVPATSTSTPTRTNTLVPATFTSTLTRTSTASSTNTLVPATSTSTASATATRTATSTNSPMANTSTATSTSTRTSTATASSTATRTASSTSTNTLALTATSTNTPVAATSTSTLTQTSTRSMTSTASLTATRTATSSSTNTPVANTSTPTSTLTSSRTATSSSTSTASPTSTNTGQPTDTFTNTPVPSTFTPTATRTASATATDTNQSTATSTRTPTASATSTSSPTLAATNSSTSTDTPVPPTNTLTVTPTITPTFTGTLPPTSSSTQTPTSTRTLTATLTFSATSTSTASPTRTNTLISTATPSPTLANTLTATNTRTSTATLTATVPPTSTNTPTLTATSTPQAGATPILSSNPADGSPIDVLPQYFQGPSNVTVQIYTVNWKLVQTKDYGTMNMGWVTLELTDDAGQPLSGGLYYVKVTTKVGSASAKLLIVR